MSEAESVIDVAYVAALARLELGADDCARLQRDMAKIVGYVAQLGQLDVVGVEPMAHAAALTNVWRDDVAGASFPREAMLANAPATVDGELIMVPPVMPGEEEG
jgi:aspartyl-tRNA(Asn)/glutamyl-tRNA(Gln) amidotransferase subunit C